MINYSGWEVCFGEMFNEIVYLSRFMFPFLLINVQQRSKAFQWLDKVLSFHLFIYLVTKDFSIDCLKYCITFITVE